MKSRKKERRRPEKYPQANVNLFPRQIYELPPNLLGLAGVHLQERGNKGFVMTHEEAGKD